MSGEFALGETSGPLTTKSPNSISFTQQGAIYWVNLVKYSLSATIDILSRISADQVDPYTATVSQVLCTQFNLSPAGRLQTTEALRALPSFSSLATGLWFGFGVRSIVRTLASTNEGGTLVALCACIKECYHEHFGAEILIELTKSSQAPNELKPSILQWMKLLDACAGVFAATHFPVLAEMYMKLRPDSGRILFASDAGDDTRQPMEEAERQAKFTEAKATCDSNLTILRTACDCSLCRGLSRGDKKISKGDEDEDEDEDDENEDMEEEAEEEEWQANYCLVALAETIIDIVRTLSAVTVAPNLKLSRIGLEIFYRRHSDMRKHQERDSITQHLGDMGQVLFVLDLSYEYDWEDTEDLAEIRLLRTLELFTGRQPLHKAAYNTSALTLKGMTAFLGILQGQGLSDPDESVGLVFITPGHIELHSKTYPCLEDLRLPVDVAHPSNGTDPEMIRYPAPDSFQHLSILIKESSKALHVAFDCCLQEAVAADEDRALIVVAPGSRNLVLRETG